MTLLRWDNLKKNKCPSCGKDWLQMGNAEFKADKIICTCGFKITEKRMAEIVNDRVRKGLEE